jgi:predicted amidohydrolase
LGFYDKRHCFSLSGEHEHYTPGTKRLIASVGGWKVNLCICYDLRFPVWTRQVIQSDPDQDPAPEFDLLIYVANWPEVRSNAWKTLLHARAIENQCYVVGVNRIGSDIHDIKHSGDSMVIDPLGEVIYHKADDEHIQTIIIDKIKLNTVREKFPFWLDGDHFLITD